MVIKDQSHTKFLEAINIAQDVESLYKSTFQIILNCFNASRVQLWEKVHDTDQMSISYDYFAGNEISLLKYRVPILRGNLKKSFDKTNIWEYINILEDFYKKYNINSLLAIELNILEKNNNLLVLTFKEESKKLNNDELSFLTTLKRQFEPGVSKVYKYQKSISDLKILIDQNNKLREQDKLRTNFINNISHELRTPLASILGFSKILTTKNPSSETAKESAEQIQLAANRLSKLIIDFLQINKIDTEGWLARFEPCDIGELIRETIDELSYLNKNCNISYTVSEDYPIIKTDPKLVRQLLDNLITNAIKYSPDFAKVIVTLDSIKDKNQITVTVTDKGIGISKEEISKVFNKFYRSSNQEVQKIPGSGLGLSICKEIINSLKGNIEAESELGKGSKFSFTLPVN